MRHLWSLLAGVLAAPVAWLLLAVGQSNATRRVADWERAGFFDTGQLVWPVLLLLVAGLGLGVLGTLRWSPAGPVAAGLLMVLPTGFMFADPFGTLDFFSYGQPRRLFGQDFAPWLPVENGSLLVLGALLLVAVASVARWRDWPVLPAPAPYPTDQQVLDGIHELTQGSAHAPMSDDEILATAAAIDEQLDGTGDQEPGEREAGEPSTAEPSTGEPSTGEPSTAGSPAAEPPAEPAGPAQPEQPPAASSRPAPRDPPEQG